MQTKRLLIAWMSLFCLIFVPFIVQATTITSCSFDKETYHQGEIGYTTVTIYNDNDDKIRLTELSATINYYYTEGTVYTQKFYTNATLPAEIQRGNSSTFHIHFSLPTNIASGYAKVDVKAVTEIWSLQSERWLASEHPTYQLKLYVESPYKQQLEEQQAVNEQLQGQLDSQLATNEQLEEQLDEQLAINKDTTNMMYLFGITTLVFAAVAGLMFILYRRTRFITRPIA